MPMTITTKFEGVYRNALEEWAYVTNSRAEDAWEGPGTYIGDGYYNDEGVPCATLRRVS